MSLYNRSTLAFSLLAIALIAPSWQPVAAQDINATLAPTPVPCESFHIDCYGCISNGCYWCPTDALCFETPEYTSSTPKTDILYPMRMHECKTPESFTQTTCTAPNNYFSDPMYSAQNWIFSNIKLVPVWERGYFGNGIRVRVNDAGIETGHPEFLGRIDVNASCPNATGPFMFDSHGTEVASVVGAAGNNDNCGVGIAPQVTLSSCIVDSPKDRNEMLTYQLDSFDISQNSWAFEGCGKLSPNQYNDYDRKLQNEECIFKHKPFDGYSFFPCDKCNFTNPDLLGEDCISTIDQHCEWFPTKDRKACMNYLDLILLRANPASMGECQFSIIPESSIEALTLGVTEGRGGKGIIYVFSSGNEFAMGDDTNYQGFGSNTRFTIPVGALGKPGNVSSFSTPGASVFVSAPGGDKTQSVTRVIAASTDGQCKDIGQGTSFAAPVVTGVIALMLDANPNLTWRDVQQILAITSQKNNDEGDRTFARNGAGLGHSNRYGFGIVNAEQAVVTSENWLNIGPERSIVREGRGPVQIPDSRANSTKLSLDLSAKDFVTETVYLYVKVNHSSRGHLRIALTSPMAGMVSVMAPGERPESLQAGWMKFTSVRHWGENPNGEWIISVTDTTPGDVNDCINYEDYRYTVVEGWEISCAPKDFQQIEQFCSNGILKQCTDSDDELFCDRLTQFTTTAYNNRTGPEACCACGGGFSPDELPETIVEWKLVVYGHDKPTQQGFFSGVGNGVELGKWGGRGRVDNKRLQSDPYDKPDRLGALTGGFTAFGGVGGVRGRP